MPAVICFDLMVVALIMIRNICFGNDHAAATWWDHNGGRMVGMVENVPLLPPRLLGRIL